MILESLVIYSCIQGKGCNESYSTYYNTHPSLKEYIEKNERNARNMINPYILDYAFPVMGFALKTYSYSFRLNRNISLNFNNKTLTLNFKREI